MSAKSDTLQCIATNYERISIKLCGGVESGPGTKNSTFRWSYILSGGLRSLIVNIGVSACTAISLDIQVFNRTARDIALEDVLRNWTHCSGKRSRVMTVTFPFFKMYFKLNMEPEYGKDVYGIKLQRASPIDFRICSILRFAASFRTVNVAYMRLCFPFTFGNRERERRRC